MKITTMIQDKEKPITAHESVRIDKELATIGEVVSRYESYFYAKDQLGCLHLMQDEINHIFEEIFRRNEK